MVRVAYATLLFLAASMPAAALAGEQSSDVVFDKNCVVTSFYGVPLDLKLADLNALKFDHTRGFVSGEGDFYPAATILVGKDVLIQAEFSTDEEPVLYQLTTASPAAIGPGGVAIGASLKDVRNRWPEGNLYWTSAHGRYVAFTNQTNVYFEFNPEDMPPNAFALPPVPTQTATGEWVSPPVEKVVPDPDKLKVQRIRISSGDFNYRCPNSDRK